MQKRSKLLIALMTIFLISGIGVAAFAFANPEPGNAGTENVTSENAETESAAPADIIITLRIDNPLMTVNGQEQSIDENGTVPTIQDGRTLLPVRTVAEAMGATVEWDGTSQTATLIRSSNVIRLTIGSRAAYFNDVENTLDAAPVIINGRRH